MVTKAAMAYRHLASASDAAVLSLRDSRQAKAPQQTEIEGAQQDEER
jgi:hypothetical protein